MTVNLDLRPEVEAALLAKARERGLSLEAYLDQVLQSAAEVSPRRNLAQFLLDSPFAGSDLDLERRQDYGRPVDL